MLFLKSPAVLLLLCPLLLAAEIENKDGRKLEAEILEADAERVKIRLPEAGREHVLNRTDLTPATNDTIDGFLTVQRQRENLTGGERVTIELEDRNNGGETRFSLLLPEPDMKAHLIGIRMTFLGREPLNNLSVGVWSPRPPEGHMDLMFRADLESKKELVISQAGDLPANDLAELRDLMKVETKQLGPWKVWMLTGWDAEDVERFPSLGEASDALIHDDDHILRIQMDTAPGGVFEPWMLPLVIESIRVEK